MGKGVRHMIDIRRVWTDFLKDESGMGVVEIILIIVVLIAMVLVFKEQITTLVNNIWKSINQSAKKIY
jgi:Flp pilus assembly pilin Flp